MSQREDVIAWLHDKLLRGRTGIHVQPYIRDGVPTDDMIVRLGDGDEYLVSFIVVKRAKRPAGSSGSSGG